MSSEITLSEYGIQELFYSYETVMTTKIYIKEQHRKYSPFFKKWENKKNPLSNYKFELYDEDYTGNIKNSPFNVIEYPREHVIFEFPDDYPEEDLFYFKMKYGGGE